MASLIEIIVLVRVTRSSCWKN